jgi:hypothetical protein
VLNSKRIVELEWILFVVIHLPVDISYFRDDVNKGKCLEIKRERVL